MQNQTLKKNQIITCTVEDLNDEGLGVVRINDYVGFVDNVLPGEEIEICVKRCKPDFFIADCITRITDSPERVKPFCQHFEQCGGCKLQHLSYPQHAKIKQKQWTDLYHKMIGSPCPIQPETVFLTPDSYRRKARISCRYVEKKQKVCVGFREKQGRYVLDGKVCPLLASDHTLFELLSKTLSRLSIARHIPQVEYARDSFKTHLIFRVLSTPTTEDINQLKSFCDQHNYIGGLQLNKSIGIIPLTQKIDDILNDIT